MLRAEQLDGVLGLIYDTALDHGAWPALLRGLADLFDAHFADSFQRTEDYRFFDGIAVGLDPADYRDEFLGVWVTRNVWGERRPVRRAGDVVTTREIMPVEQLVGSEMYNDYLAPRDLQEGLRLDLHAGGGTVEDVSILRPWSAGPYRPEELRAARLLLPHLQRARAMSRRLAVADSMSAAGFAAIEALPNAVLLLDRQRRLLHANRAGRGLLAEADGLAATAGGGLVGAGAAAGALERVLAAAAGPVDRPGRSGSLRLRRPSGKPSLMLLALPLGPGHAPLLAELSCVPAMIVCVADPGRQPALRQDELRVWFGLTGAEAALAADLLCGHELGEIARRTGRSVNTLRSLLARLMAKTDTNRQSALVRLLASLPPR